MNLRQVSLGVILLLSVAGLAGCLHENNPDGNRSSNPERDDLFPDDRTFLMRNYGIRQITNSSGEEIPRRALINDDFIAWIAGGNGNPVFINALNYQKDVVYQFHYPVGLIPSGFYLHDSTILTSGHPVIHGEANTSNRTFFFWHLKDNSTAYFNVKFDYPTSITGFNDGWIILEQHRENPRRYDLVGMDLNTMEVVSIFNASSDQQSTGNIVVMDNSTFYNIRGKNAIPCHFSFEQSSSTCPTHALSTNATIEAVTRDYVFFRLTASEYLSHLFMINRKTNEIQQLTFGNTTFNQVAAADHWVIYKLINMEPIFVTEDAPYPQFYLEESISYVVHSIDSSESVVVIPQNEDIYVDSWTTNGEIIAIVGQTYERNPNIKYPGTQMYWMNLPDIAK